MKKMQSVLIMLILFTSITSLFSINKIGFANPGFNFYIDWEGSPQSNWNVGDNVLLQTRIINNGDVIIPSGKLNAIFSLILPSGSLQITGYDINSNSINPGQSYTFNYYWSSTSASPGSYGVKVDVSGTVGTTLDKVGIMPNAFSLLGGVDNAAITSWTPPSGTLRAGATASASVTIKNTGTTTRSFWVGITWWDSARTTHDVTPKQSTSLVPDGQATLSFSWTIPSGAAIGSCEVGAGVWNGYSGGLMVSPEYDSRDQVGAFTIVGNNPPPGTYVDIYWPKNNNYNYDVDLIITNAQEKDVNILFWSHQFSFVDGQGGYIGLQVVGSSKKAIFSIWGAVSGNPGGFIEEDGKVWRCLIDYDWKLNQKYRLRVWELNKETNGDEWWVGAVYDYAAQKETQIGTILVPASWSWLSSTSITWIEYAGYNNYKPTDLPYTRCLFSNLYSRNAEKNGTPEKLQVSYGTSTSTNSNVKYYGNFTYALEAGDNVIRDTQEGWLELQTHDTISFSGYTWSVEHSEVKTNPGPNYWSNKEENVWVDEAGQLHLKITYRNGAWYCAEVSTTQVLGNGTYTFTAASRIDTMDKNVVLGLFAYKDDNHETDIEFSKWGNSNNANAWYSVQPRLTDNSNVKSFNMALSGTYSTHSFTWSSSGVSFISIHGDYKPTDAPLTNIIQTWSSSLTREAEGARAHINLWLNEGTPPSDGKEIEVVIKSFQFTPIVSRGNVIASLDPPYLKLSPGRSFKIDVKLDPGNYGISGGELYLKFDPSAIQITDITIGNLLGESPLKAVDDRNNNAGTLIVALARVGKTPVPTNPGTLITVFFKIEGQVGKEYKIEITKIKLSDSNFNDIIGIKTSGCSVSIPTQIPEDINGDDVVDYKDLAILGASYGKSKGDPDFNSAADINGDGKVDYRDLAILGAKYKKE